MAGNGYTTFSELQDLCDVRQYADVVIPHIDDSKPPLKFRIQSISEAEWSEISSTNFDLKRGGFNPKGLRESDARLAAVSLVDGDGNRLLRGDKPHLQLMQLGAWVVEPLVRACRELNNLRGLEDEEKNSLAGSDLDSNSAEVTQHSES